MAPLSARAYTLAMSPTVQRLLETTWELEQVTAKELRDTEQQILGRAAARGMIDSPGTLASVGTGYIELIDRTARKIMASVERTLKAQAARPDGALCQQVLWRLGERLATWTDAAHSKLEGLRERGRYGSFALPFAGDAAELRKRLLHDCEIMLAEIGRAGKNETAVNNNTFNFTGSQQVQIGDHNVQQAHLVVFQELLQKIDAANAPAEQKAEAKSRLQAFLTHPLTVATAGGLAGALGSSLK